MMKRLIATTICFLFLLAEPCHSQHLDMAWKKMLDSQADPAAAIVSRHWFLGYVEGKTDMAPPRFWSEAILTCQTDRVLTSFSPVDKKSSYYLNGFIECPRNTQIELGKGSASLKVGETTVLITDPELVRRLGSVERLRAKVANDRVFLALHDSGVEYPLYCIDKNSTKILWMAEVEPLSKQTPFVLGRTAHYVTILIRQDSVYVYGASNMSVYISQFGLESGKLVAEFTTDKYQLPQRK
jgi:hypothetical protein